MTPSMPRPLVVALLIVVALALTACANDDTPAASGGVATTAGTLLRYTLWPEGKDTTVDSSRTYVITCDDAAADADCAALFALGDDVWAPVPPDLPCTQPLGGPEVMEVTGTLRGRPVDAAFSRDGGCEIERWDAAYPVLQRLGVQQGGWSAFGATDLQVTHRPKGPANRAGERRLTITCPEVPEDTDKDCQELLGLAAGDLFDAGLPPGTVCTEIYGGPQAVLVQGVLAGRNVDTVFTRTDGCRIERWDRAVPLLLRMGRR